MPRPSHSSRFDHPNNVWWAAQIINLFIMYFSSLPCYLVSLMRKYPFIFEHSQPTFLPKCERPSFTPIPKTGRIIVMCIFIFIFLYCKLEDKSFYTEWKQTFPDFILLLISSWIESWSVRSIPNIELFHPFKETIIALYIVALFCVLISRHDHVINFTSIYF